jgi:hypothetical protein
MFMYQAFIKKFRKNNIFKITGMLAGKEPQQYICLVFNIELVVYQLLSLKILSYFIKVMAG